MSSERSLAQLAFRAKLVKISAWAYCALTVIQLLLTGYLFFKPSEIVVTAPGAEPSVPILPFVLTGNSILALLATVVLVISAFIWIYRAHANLIEQGTELDHSPGWTVGSYFIPFVNLLVPFRAMRELYNRSHGEIPEHAHSTVDDVTAWWTAYILGLTLWFLLILKFTFDAATNIVFLTPPWMEFAMGTFCAFLLVVAAIMLAKIVGKITQAQYEANHAWSAFE